MVKSVYIAAVHPSHPDSCSPTVKLDIRSQHDNIRLGQISVIPDTGSSVNIMTTSDYARLGRDWRLLQPPATVPKAYNMLPISLVGQDTFKLGLGDRFTTRTFFITDEGEKTIISKAACKALGIIPADFPKQIDCSSANGHSEYASGTDQVIVSPDHPQASIPPLPDVEPTTCRPPSSSHPDISLKCASEIVRPHSLHASTQSVLGTAATSFQSDPSDAANSTVPPRTPGRLKPMLRSKRTRAPSPCSLIK